MKRIALLTFALFAVAIAEKEMTIESVAEHFESDVKTVQGCLDDSEVTITDIQTMKEKVEKMQDDEEEIDDDTKEAIEKHSSFLACMLEKNGMMQDSKLVVDKIVESMSKDKEITQNKEDLTKCMDSLNEDSELGREGRAMGLMICVVSQLNESKR